MNCPICPEKNNLREQEQYGEYRLYECQRCLVQFWHPLINPGQTFYEKSELHEIKGKKELQWRHQQFFKNPPLSRGRCLDIGCGTGEFLARAINLGLEGWGIDLSSKQIEAAKEFYGLKNVYNSDLETFLLRQPPLFDIITVFEVLEHLDNPRDFLTKVKKILKPGGFLVLTVPNVKRLGAGREVEEKPPNHLFRWSVPALRNFLFQEGFNVLELTEQPLAKEFFFTTGFFNLGLVKKLKSLKANKETSLPSPEESLKLFHRLAVIKNILLQPVAALLAVPFRLLGYKYWDLYVVTQLP